MSLTGSFLLSLPLMPDVESLPLSENFPQACQKRSIFSCIYQIQNLHQDGSIKDYWISWDWNSDFINDTFWNRESISGSDESFGYENATAIAYALKELNEYSCAVTPQIRQTGNRLSGNAGTAYASLLA